MTDGSAHTVRSFDAALTGLSKLIVSFGGLVTSQVEDAVRALLTGDDELAARVIVREKEINALDQQVEDKALRLVATRSPKGRDLRAVFGMLKTGTDLERVGDEAKKIAKVARIIAAERPVPSERLAAAIENMSAKAVSLLTHLLSAIDAGDEEGVITAAESDRALDREYKSAMSQIQEMIEEDGELLVHIADAVLTLKSIERVGDHAKNIAKHYVFYTQGRNVQHVKTRDLREAASGERE